MKHSWQTINPVKFMKEMAMCDEGGQEVIFTMKSRGDVSSRMWFTLEWTGADSKRYSEAAQTIDMLFERAAQREIAVREMMGRSEVKNVVG